MARDHGIVPDAAIASEVLGVVVEVPIERSHDALAAYADGSVRYLNHAGGASVVDEPPPARDEMWRSGRPPSSGWRRIETVPDGVVRGLVRSGALALKEAAQREGVPGAQPRAEVADALLDSVVITASDDDGRSAEVTLRALSALTRMGFLPRGGDTHIDVAGRWVRVVAQYGSVYLERPGGLVLR